MVLSEITYDPDTGTFTAGGQPVRTYHKHSGYRAVCVEGRAVYAHRLAWRLMTGEWPAGNIDHIDLNPANNAWANLRLCNQSQNCANAPARKSNTSGFKGVSRDGQRWRATIMVNRRQKWLGAFDTPEEAASAYQRAAEQHFGDFARSA